MKRKMFSTSGSAPASAAAGFGRPFEDLEADIGGVVRGVNWGVVSEVVSRWTGRGLLFKGCYWSIRDASG